MTDSGDQDLGERTSSDPLISPSLDLDAARYLIFGLDRVEGWGLDLNLARVFMLLNDFQLERHLYGNLFEIGVHHGRSAIFLSLMCSHGEKAVFVDIFDRQDENIDFSGRGDRAIFEENLRTWAPHRPHVVVQANSLALDFRSIDALASGVRFAHIDGAHYKAAVMNDITQTASVLRSGGVIVVDDFLHTGFPGVNEACNAYLERQAEDRLAVVAMGRNKLILADRAFHADLLEHLSARLGIPSHRHFEFHDDRVLSLDGH